MLPLGGCVTGETVAAAREHTYYKPTEFDKDGKPKPQEVDRVEKAKPAYYALVPLAVAADIALIPAYFVFIVGVNVGIFPVP
jgi:hypothetical protein